MSKFMEFGTLMCPWIIFIVLVAYFLLILTIKLFHANSTIYNKGHFNQIEPFIVEKKNLSQVSQLAWKSSLLISFFINSQSWRTCVSRCSLQVRKFLLPQISLLLISHLITHSFTRISPCDKTSCNWFLSIVCHLCVWRRRKNLLLYGKLQDYQ